MILPILFWGHRGFLSDLDSKFEPRSAWKDLVVNFGFGVAISMVGKGKETKIYDLLGGKIYDPKM